jgi:hypothetical protein
VLGSGIALIRRASSDADKIERIRSVTMAAQ